ncbi:MAG: PQQ-dependent sugar dehydrogenase [Rhodospirillaceae bacterium]|nr:PQQ-dependent sugar dehydrogenase [Rhodospirillaceae bacterium]
MRQDFVTGCAAALLLLGTVTHAVAGPAYEVRPLAEGLEHPWSIALTPDGRLLVTERPGRLQRIDPATGARSEIAGLPDVRARAEAGLMGLALDPDFAANGALYLCYSSGSLLQPRNRLSRFTLSGDALADEAVLLDDMPGAMWHNGCRVAVSPDGFLFASMGDATDADAAQNPRDLAGKIFRLNRDGSIPADNPDPGSPVWSFGHRNPQGLAFRPEDGALWSTEHGPDTQDELNLIERGMNYGWPRCRGVDPCGDLADYRAAKAEFNRESTIAISNLIFYQGAAFPEWRGDILFVALKTGRLYRVDLDGDTVVSHEILIDNRFGRLRTLAEAPDGSLYLATDNGEDAILHLTRK